MMKHIGNRITKGLLSFLMCISVFSQNAAVVFAADKTSELPGETQVVGNDDSAKDKQDTTQDSSAGEAVSDAGETQSDPTTEITDISESEEVEKEVVETKPSKQDDVVVMSDEDITNALDAQMLLLANDELMTRATQYSLTVKYLETGKTAGADGATFAELCQGASCKWNVGLNSSLGWDAIAMFTINGKTGYCIEPLEITYHGYKYTAGGSPDKYVTASKAKTMELYAYFGYGYNGDYSKEMYAATQVLIWQQRTSVWSIDSSIQSKMDQIKARVADYNKTPTISQNIVLSGYGQENAVTLTDSNKVFGDYTITSYSNGLHVSKSGDKITVWADAPITSGTIKSQLIPSSAVGDSIAYVNANDAQKVSVFKVRDQKEFDINVKVISGSLTLTKQDSITGSTPQGDASLLGAIVDLYADASCTQLVGTFNFSDSLTKKISNLTIGKTYYLKERVAGKGYALNKNVKSVTITKNGDNSVNISTTFSNSVIKGKVPTITKQDGDSGKTIAADETTFDVFSVSSGKKVTSVSTSNGVTKDTEVPYGDYFMVESSAAEGYYNDNSFNLEFSITSNGQSSTASLSNTRSKGEITINKRDTITNTEAQGEAKLDGAVYGLYAAENIIDPADGSVAYAKDALVQKLTIENLTAKASDLFLGKYYIQEITPSVGYTLDETRYDVTLSYAGQSTEIVSDSVTSNERVISQAFKIMKVESDGSTGTAAQLQGAEFTIKLKSDVEKYGWDDAPIAKNANNETAAIMVTDAEGVAISDELPYGEYVVRETKTPDEHWAIQDFTITIDEDSRTPQQWRVFNDAAFKAYVAVVKKDAETGKTVAKAGASYKIKTLQDITIGNGNNNKFSAGDFIGMWNWSPTVKYMDVFTTDESGQVMTPQTLPAGSYELYEVQAPNGYTINEEPVAFEITSKGAYEIGPDGVSPVFTVIQSNTSVKGKIDVSKHGDALLKASNNDGNTTFTYGDQGLQDATFELYARDTIYSQDNQGTILYKKDQLIATLNSDEKGNLTFGDNGTLPLGEYYVKETKAPQGYVLNNESFDVTLSYADQNTPVVSRDVDVSDARQKVAVSIIKSDSQTGDTLSGAQFTIYNSDPIKTSDGTTAIEADTALESVTTGKDGKAVFTLDLPLGNYYVKETKAPDGYASSNQKITIDATYQGQDVTLISTEKGFVNDITQVEISKQDKETGNELANAVMRVSKDGVIIDEWTNVNTSRHVIKGLLVGETYTLQEVSAPDGYLLADPITFTVADSGDIQHVTMKDTRVLGNIDVYKSGEVLTGISKDKDGNVTFNYEEQGLANAVYEIYAAEDIHHPDGQSADLYHEGDLVETIVTGKDGHAVSKDLPLGLYTVKEKNAPNGYVLDQKDQTIALTYEDPYTALVSENVSFENDRQKCVVRVEKKDADDASKKVEGAQFTLYAKEDIASVDGTILLHAGDKVETFTSAENGMATVKADLPTALYEVRETKAPLGYASSNEIKEVDLRYTDQDTPTLFYESSFTNAPIKVEVSKQDITTGVEIPGALLQVFDKDGNKVDEWTSLVNKKHLIKYLHVGETYTLHEETAPYGYVQASDVKFTIADTREIQPVEMKDELVKGEITVYKEGEVLVGTHESKGKVAFDYETQRLANATYEIYAAEDIHHPDTVSEDFYKQGDLVATITTNEKGEATSAQLPLGNYIVKEKTAPEGFVLNSQEKAVALEYAGQKEELVFDSATQENDRQKIEVNIRKVDADSGERLAGAQFTIYNKDAIYSVDGSKLVAADTAIETVTTKENGYVRFKSDLPLGSYYIKETKAPIGYASSDEIIELDGSYQGQDVTIVSLTGNTFANEITKTQINKIDATTNEALRNSILAIYPLNADGTIDAGSAFDTWVSTDSGHMIYGLEPGKTYRLVEIKPAEGFTTAVPIDFTVADTGEIQTHEMVDESTKVDISKTDLVTGKEIVGATLTIYPVDANDEPILGEAFTTWISDGNAHRVEQLPIGRYLLRESVAPYDDGYIRSEDILFDVADTLEVQKVEMKDDHTRVSFTKSDLTTGEEIEGATLAIIPLDEDGNPKEGETFETWVSDGSEHLVEYLPIGDYILRETSAPFDNGYVTAEDVRFTVEETGEVQKVEMKDDHTKVLVSKIDSATKEPIKGATLTILPVDAQGNIEEGAAFDTWVSDGSDHLIEYIPTGDYVLRELSAPYDDGYVTADDVHFTVEDTPDEQKVVMSDDHTILDVSKIDVTTGKLLKGAVLAIYPLDDNGDPILDECFTTLVSGDEAATRVEYIPTGNYVLRELKAPYGFAKADDVYFTITDTNEVQSVAMENEQVIGNFYLTKSGEMFTDIETQQSEYGETYTPIWTQQHLKDAEITIYATEDITLENDVTYFQKGDAVQTFYTNGEEQKSIDLYVGEYYWQETHAPQGYALDSEKHYFTIEDSQSSEIQEIHTDAQNARQTFTLDVAKVLEEQQTFIDPDAYQDVVFGIYAKEDIRYPDGSVAIEKGSLIGTSGIDAQGKLSESFDLPAGEYVLKELATNDQYQISEESYPFTISYGDETQANITVAIHDGEIYNALKRGSIEIVKTDSKEETTAIAGVTFELASDADFEHIIATAISDEDGRCVFDQLEMGTYFVRESKQADGYVLDDTVHTVVLNENEQVKTLQLSNTQTAVDISKQDITTKEELPGAELEIIDKETNEVVESWTSTKEAHRIYGLKVDHEYILKETRAPQGYQVAESISFKLENTIEVQKIVMYDEESVDTGVGFQEQTPMILLAISAMGMMSLIVIKRRKEYDK